LSSPKSPFEQYVVKEIPLPNAPLIRVIGQVRFPIIVSIEDMKYIGNFQERIRDIYPTLKPEQSVVLNLLGTEPKKEETVWRFFDDSENWRLTLAPNFLALEAVKYTSRDDFLQRFKDAITVLGECITPKHIDRIGIRYIDQVKGDELSRIKELVRPEILGAFDSPIGEAMAHSLTQNLYKLESGAKFSTRWGLLGERQTYDAASLMPLEEKSWMLDLDMYSESRREFSVEETISEATQFAETIYRFFRWAVTDEFLKAYGGEA